MDHTLQLLSYALSHCRAVSVIAVGYEEPTNIRLPGWLGSPIQNDKIPVSPISPVQQNI